MHQRLATLSKIPSTDVDAGILPGIFVCHCVDRTFSGPSQHRQSSELHWLLRGRKPRRLSCSICSSVPLFTKLHHDFADNQILHFIVQAMHDYNATTDQEFDLKTGDVIAVMETPWETTWKGELLDRSRRQRGRTEFPSQFVRLLE